MKYLKIIILLSLITFGKVSAIPALNPNESILYYGSTYPVSIIHYNGNCAWTGIYPKNVFSYKSAFFHANGKMAWGGLVQGRQSYTTERGYFLYDTGAKAWGGINQNQQSWISENGKFFHSNGKLAWGGIDNNRQSWISENGKFYHYNGQVAWNGLFGSPVYYANGKKAWDGNSCGALFDEYGNYLTIGDYIYLYLGDGNWLYINSEGRFELSLFLGDGIYLKAKRNCVLFEVCGQLFDVDNDF